MSQRLLECVPNISEGRDMDKIRAIADVVETIEGVKLLDIDPGKTTNRTVITFVGEPEAVCEAAFLLIRKAAETIDMRRHKGEHPRMGATDVCPLVPISGISMEEAAEMARQLGKRVGAELGIPGYFYESAATRPERKNLAHCRSGEYEGLEKLSKEGWEPDFGPAYFSESVKRTGAMAIGARDFLVAYNVNLNTTSTRRANAIAFDIREAGRTLREGDSLTGKPVLSEDGEPLRVPGTLRAVKGIGWYIEEYGIAQLSLNLTNIGVTPVHVAFEEAVVKAAERGVRVTGSEIVGLIPKRVLLEAADFYLRRQQRSLGIPEAEKIKIAVRSLGLNDLQPFDASEKVIEYKLAKLEGSVSLLRDKTLRDFVYETASESPAPGGGSVSALCGALGASLATMVANLSAHKRGWDERWEEFSGWAVKGMEYASELLEMVDKDTDAFNTIMEAFGLPKDSDEDKKARKEAIARATKVAIEIPMKVAELSLASMEVMRVMALEGNPNSITDAGVGALCARTAVIGACMNARVNAKDYEDKAFSEGVLQACSKLESEAESRELEIRNIVALNLSPK
jgi:glutamate formiminotransferase/formiminotetrahydrofolate cyclodeaminase